MLLLFLPEHTVTCTQKEERIGVGSPTDSQLQSHTGALQQKAEMHDDEICRKGANLQDTSTPDTTAALQSTSMYMEKAIMQATMLHAYQAHQLTRHHSKISILSSMGLQHSKLCNQEPRYGLIYDSMLRNGCRAVLVAMHKTLYMERRDICGPIILCYHASLPLDVRVCF